MAMFGALFRPLGHLLCDDTRIDAVAARLCTLLAQFPRKRFAPLPKGLFRAAVALRQAALQDVKTTAEGKAVGIEVFPLGGLKHQSANHKMPQRQCTQFLNHPGRSFTAEVGGFGGPTRRAAVRNVLVASSSQPPC